MYIKKLLPGNCYFLTFATVSKCSISRYSCRCATIIRFFIECCPPSFRFCMDYCLANYPAGSKDKENHIFLLQTGLTDLPQSEIPAFPGAEGGGKFSFGGRGGKVIVVTNLNDDGPGSFRWACEQGGARIVVFNVAGIIRIKTPLIIRAPYITIAGQTAPGDGVCVAGETVWINTHDVIIRYMRFRRGETWVGRRDDAIGGNPIGNIMIDHVSASWGLG